MAINLPYYVRPGDIYSQIMGQGQAAPRTMADYYPGFTGGYDSGLYQRLRDEAAARAAAQGAAVPGLLDGGGGPGEVSMGTSFGNPAEAIAFGQALQGYGRSLGGMAPGGLLAGLLGSGIVNAGVNALGAMEAQAAEQAAQAATLGQTVADVFGVAYDSGGYISSGGIPGEMGLGPGASAAEMNAISDAIAADAAATADAAAGAAGAAAGAAAGEGLGYGGEGYGGEGPGSGGFYAKGGKVTMRGLLVDEMLPGPDDGYAALQAGEYVIKKSTTKKLGDKKLQALNEGRASIKMRKE